MKKILFFKDYLTRHFGRPLYRIPIDLPLGCPHRIRGGGKGCIFCADDGARARHLQYGLDLETQVETGIAYAQRRYDAVAPYIAYFQSFTNTNAEVSELRNYYRQVLDCADFSMVIIATRPDCLSEEVIGLLRELQQEYEVWIELGVQSAHDRTLELINRQHDFAAVKSAVKRLHAAGIKAAAHVILGLPGETMQDYLATGDALSALPFSGIKIHNLLVLKNTPLAKMYSAGKVKTLNEYEYAEALVAFLHCLPDSWPVMRLTAEAEPQQIVAPKWWMKKGQFIEYVTEIMESGETDTSAYPKIRTGDGSCTFYHPEFRQHFHTLAGAQTEAEKKFIHPCRVRKRLASGRSLRILDVGFGLGYNAFAAIGASAENSGPVEIVSLELNRKPLQIAGKIFPEDSAEKTILDSLLENGSWEGQNAKIRIEFGDARKSVLKTGTGFDAVFLDGFSPETNPELWTFDFIRQLAKRLGPDGIIATYSSAYPIRGALMRCALHLGESEPFGRKRGGSVAAFNAGLIEKPLPDKEFGIVKRSTAGVPYRDPGLCQTRKKILKYRAKLLKKLKKRGIPRWLRDCP